MMTLLFYRSGDKPVHSAGPVPYIRIVGGSLRVGPEGSQLAHYRGGFWRVSGREAPKFIVTGSGALRLEAERPDEPVALGEFAQLEFVDGAVYSRPGSALLAQLDESAAAWYLYADSSLHSSLILEESHFSGRSGTGSRSPAIHSRPA